MYAAHMRRIASAPEFAHVPSIPDERSFNNQLSAFNRRHGRSLVCPQLINGTPINLHQLYSSVIRIGGYTKVTERKLWSEVAAELHIPPGCVNDVIALRRIYFHYLVAFEGDLRPDLRVENLWTPLEDTYDHSNDRYIPVSVDRVLGIIAPRPAYLNPGIHRSASTAALHSSMTPSYSRANLDVLHRLHEYSALGEQLLEGADVLPHPENLFCLRPLTVLENAEKSILSGLSNEVDLSLNSVLFLSALVHSSNATPLRLSQTNNLLALLLASVGIYDDGPGSLRVLAETWVSNSSLDFSKFWENMVDEAHRKSLENDSVLLEEHSQSILFDKTLCEAPIPILDVEFDNEEEVLFNMNHLAHSDSVTATDTCLSRVLSVATLLVNLVTPPSPAPSSHSVHMFASQEEEDDDELEQAIVFSFVSQRGNRCSRLPHLPASRSLVPDPSLPPLSCCRDNARHLSASLSSIRFAFLCAYARHSSLRQLGLQLVGSLRYTLGPGRSLLSINRLQEVSFTNALTGLEVLSVRFLCHTLIQSSDRCDMLAGLHLLTNLLRVPDGVNIETLFAGLPNFTWARLIQLLCLPDLGLVCAALEALYCATGMGLFACTRLWRALAIADDMISQRAPNSVFAVRHASIHLRPLLALLSLEGQSMGTGSLHRVKVLQRQAHSFQPMMPLPFSKPIHHLPPSPVQYPYRPVYGHQQGLPQAHFSNSNPHSQYLTAQGSSINCGTPNFSGPPHQTLPHHHNYQLQQSQYVSQIPPPAAQNAPPSAFTLQPLQSNSPRAVIPHYSTQPNERESAPRLVAQPCWSSSPSQQAAGSSSSLQRAPSSSLVSLLNSVPASTSPSSPPIPQSSVTTTQFNPSKEIILSLTSSLVNNRDDASNNDASKTSSTSLGSSKTSPVVIPSQVVKVKSKPESLSEITDRMQMPPPSLPPPSALRRVSKQFSSPTRSPVSGTLSSDCTTSQTKPILQNVRSGNCSSSPNRANDLPSSNGNVKQDAISFSTVQFNEAVVDSKSQTNASGENPKERSMPNADTSSTLSPIILPSRDSTKLEEKPHGAATSLLEEVLNAPSTKSQLSSLLGSHTNSKSSTGRLVNGSMSPYEQRLAATAGGGNGIKKDLSERLLVSKSEESLVHKVSSKRIVNGDDSELDEPKKSRLSSEGIIGDSTPLEGNDEKRIGAGLLLNSTHHLTNGLRRKPSLSAILPPDAIEDGKMKLPPITNVENSVDGEPLRQKHQSQCFSRRIKYNRRNGFLYLQRRHNFPLLNRIDVPKHRRQLSTIANGSPVTSLSPPASDRKAPTPPPNRVQTPPPFICEWDSCLCEFTTTKQVSSHIYSAHFNYNSFHPKSIASIGRRCCLWSDCPSAMVPRAPYALVGHVLDFHCSSAELQSRRSARSLGVNRLRHSQPTHQLQSPHHSQLIGGGGSDQSGWSIIKEVETRRLQSDLWLSQMGGPQAQRYLASGRNGPCITPSGLPPREGPVTKHLRVTAALVLRNLATNVPEARKWLASETPLLCEIAMGTCPGASNLRTNDAGHIIAQCLAICEESNLDEFSYWPFRRGQHSVDLDA